MQEKYLIYLKIIQAFKLLQQAAVIKGMRARGFEPPHPIGYKDLNLPGMSIIGFLGVIMRVG